MLMTLLLSKEPILLTWKRLLLELFKKECDRDGAQLMEIIQFQFQPQQCSCCNTWYVLLVLHYMFIKKML